MKNKNKFILFIFIIFVILSSCNIIESSGNASKLIKTNERNYNRSYTSYLTMKQNDLFCMADLIFSGTFKYSENYTYIYYEDGEENKEYLTFYCFRVNNIYYGDETLLNKEIKVGQRNAGHYGDKEEIVLKENSDYVLFAEQCINSELERVGGIPLYAVSLYQTIFEMSGLDIYISHELFGQNMQEEMVDPEVSDFMSFWLEKQNNDNKIIFDDGGDEFNSEDNYQNIKKGDVFTFSNIESIKSVLNINDVSVDTNIGLKSRLSVQQSIFNDFIIDAINYYKNK